MKQAFKRARPVKTKSSMYKSSILKCQYINWIKRKVLRVQGKYAGRMNDGTVIFRKLNIDAKTQENQVLKHCFNYKQLFKHPQVPEVKCKINYKAVIYVQIQAYTK